jgi:hypothetical protein
MGRPAYGGRTTCESCKSIDVRRWHREGRLRAGQRFSCSWTRGGAPSGSISVRTEADAVLLTFQYRSSTDPEWQSLEQRVPITWTGCHLGGRRPWFICTVYTGGRYCGRRVALLYLAAGELFACRRCCGLAYASQQETLWCRGLGKAQKIRAQLGGSPNMLEGFPDRPKGMHWKTYDRLRRIHDLAEQKAMMGLTQFADRLRSRVHTDRPV